jgi:hypothetical protein
MKQQENVTVEEDALYNVSLIIEPRDDPNQKGKTGSVSRSKSTKFAAPLEAGETMSKKDTTHQSWNTSDDKANKLVKFFGMENADIELYQKLNSGDSSKNTLDDLELVKISLTFMTFVAGFKSPATTTIATSNLIH